MDRPLEVERAYRQQFDDLEASVRRREREARDGGALKTMWRRLRRAAPASASSDESSRDARDITTRSRALEASVRRRLRQAAPVSASSEERSAGEPD